MAQRHQFIARWWDQQASCTVLLTAAGWQPSAIAEYLGRAEWEIEAILKPRRIDRQAEFIALWPVDADRVPRERAFAQHVESNMAQALSTAYSHAAHRAAAEGFPELESQLESRGEEIFTRWNPDPGTELDAATSAVLWGAATYDSRYAVGIESSITPLASSISAMETSLADGDDTTAVTRIRDAWQN